MDFWEISTAAITEEASGRDETGTSNFDLCAKISEVNGNNAEPMENRLLLWDWASNNKCWQINFAWKLLNVMKNIEKNIYESISERKHLEDKK